MFETIRQDVRFALRSLRPTPGFTAVVVLTLALGIGANTAIFSLLDAVMLKPLPVPNADELFFLHVQAPEAEPDRDGGTGRWLRFSYPSFKALEQALPPDASLAAMTRVTPYDVRSEGHVTPAIGVQLVSGQYFKTFGVWPARGRLLTDADNDRVDAHPVAVVSHTYWQRTFGGDAAAIGRSIRVNNVPFTIVGIAPPGFAGVWSDSPVAIWIPLMMQHTVHYASNSSGYGPAENELLPWAPQEAISWLTLVARSPHGLVQSWPRLNTTFRAELTRTAQSLSTAPQREQLLHQTLGFDRFDRGFSVLRRQYGSVLTFLMALVVLVLLIACANIANLMLVRAAARERDILVRLSIGASRILLIRQLLTEGLMLSGAGVAVAIAVARAIDIAITSRVLNLPPDALPPAFAQDGRALAFAAMSAVVATLLFALTPAFMMTRAGGRSTLSMSGKGVGAGTLTRSLRALVVVQVAIAFLLVMTAAWFGQSLFNLWRVDPGFEPDHIVGLSINPRNSGYTPRELPALYERLVTTARSIPGVQAAAVAECGLSEGCRSIGSYQIEGYADDMRDGTEIRGNRIGAGYFSTIGTRVLEGREFEPWDVEGSAPVAIVTRAMVARYFGGRSPLGKRIGNQTPTREIIGVVDNARVADLHEEPVPMVYVPIAQTTAFAYSLTARVNGDPGVLAPVLQQAIGRREPRLAIFNALTLDDRLERNVASDTLVVYLSAGFGLLALLLASLGLYGVLAYVVTRRTGEIGIRMALGARPPDVRRMVVGDGLRVALLGVIIGAVGALAAGRLIQTLLFGVTPSDPLTYGAIAAALLAVAFLASFLPARRAARVDPMTALRGE